MAEELLARAKASGTDDHGKHDRSVMSILCELIALKGRAVCLILSTVKAESGTHLSKVEVRDTVSFQSISPLLRAHSLDCVQVKLLLVAGYETTAGMYCYVCMIYIDLIIHLVVLTVSRQPVVPSVL